MTLNTLLIHPLVLTLQKTSQKVFSTTRIVVANGHCVKFQTGCLRVLMAVLALAIPVRASNWYVDSNAGGANDGTSWANAWKSLANISGVQPGDTVFISGGSSSQTYPVNAWSPPGGVDGNPITYQTGQDAGQNGVVILNANGNQFCLSDTSNVVFSGNVNGAQNMELTGQSNRAIYIGRPGTHNMRFSYLYIPNAPGVFYINNVVNGNGFEFDNSWIHKNSPPASNGGRPDDVFYLGGVAGGGFDTNLIHDNYVEMPCNASEPAFGDDGVKWGDGTSVYNNHFKIYLDSNYPYGPQYQHADIAQISGDYWKFYGNFYENVGESVLFHDNNGSVSGNFQHIWFYNNIIWQNPAQRISAVARGLDFEPQDNGRSVFDDVLVANNSFCNITSTFCLRFTAATFQNCNVVNNVFINCNSPSAGAVAGVSWFYNKGSGAPSSSGPANNNPVVFVNLGAGDLHLASTDTGAIGAGTNFPAGQFTTDKDGKTRPASSWALGAYEYSSSGPTGPQAPKNLRIAPAR